MAQEFDIRRFVNSIRENLYRNFPYMKSESLNLSKHKKRPLHIRDVAFMNNQVEFINENMFAFEIGNETAETNYPYYHILQDSQIINKRRKSTKKTRGSQSNVEVSKRDYGKVDFNGKTFTKEYRRNIGVRRSILSNATRWVGDTLINKEANYYLNVHYNYIDRTLKVVLPFIAEEYGIRLKKIEKTSLADEYIQEVDDIGTYESYDDINGILKFIEDNTGE